MDDVVKIIRIETGGSEQTVKGLKDEINSLRDALLNTEKGSKEYKDILEQLIADQQKLTEVMAAGKTQVSAATGSYNALVNQMAALKKVWRETTDETTRKDLGKQIKSINNQLKDFDASIGDFRRQVGDYTNSITSAFGAMGGAAKGMIGPINGVKTAFTALSAHPLVAVITALAALLINGLVKGFKSSEEATNKLKVAFSGFKAIGDTVLKIFQGLALGIANLGNAIVNLLDKWGLLPESFKERQKIAEDEIKLTKKQRDNITKNANLEKEIAQLRADSADKNKYTAQQRLDFLEQAMKKEEEIAKNEYEALEQEYNIIVAKNALAKSNAVDKDAEAKALAAKIAAETKYLEKKRSNNKETSRINKEMVRDAQQAELSMLNLQKDLIQQEYNLATDGSDKQLQLAKELRKKELDIQIAGFKQKIKNRKDYNQAVKLAIQAYNTDIEKLEYEAVNKAVERERVLTKRRSMAYKEGSSEYYKVLMQEETKIHNLYKAILESEGDLSHPLVEAALLGFENASELTQTLSEKSLDQIKDMELESLKALRNIIDAFTQAEETETDVFNQTVLNGITPMSEYYKKQVEQLKEYYDLMSRYNNETKDQFAARQQAVWNQILTAENNYWSALGSEAERGAELYNRYRTKAIITEKELLKEQEQAHEDSWQRLSAQMEQYITENAAKVAEDLQMTEDQIQTYINWVVTEMVDGVEEIHKVGFTKIEELLINAQKFPEAIMDAYLEHLHKGQELYESTKDYYIKGVENSVNAIKDLLNNVSDAYEQELRYQVKKKKMSEDAAKEEFETVKKMRIAVAVIDTIQGALAAFMGWQDKGQPLGAIMGTISAAAVAAAGAAQIRQIQMTEFGSTSSGGGSSSVSMASVTPVMMDYQPQLTGNVTGQQEAEELANAITSKPIRAYVVESDISNAQQLANQRTNESTF